VRHRTIGKPGGRRVRLVGTIGVIFVAFAVSAAFANISQADENESAEPSTVAASISAGDVHTCAILDDLGVKCFGANHAGSLGLGDPNPRGSSPGQMGDALPFVDLGPGRTARAISAGVAHTCAILDTAELKCWGANLYGQLGLGDTASRGISPGQMGDALPTVDLGAGRQVEAVSAGGFHTCAILDDGTVRCWGYNRDAQLGLGHTEDRGDEAGEMGGALPTVDLGTGRTARAIAAGRYHSCAILDDGSVKCWGSGHHLGSGTTDTIGDEPGEMGDALPTVDLGTGRTATAITVGQEHTCVILDDATVKCWGYGESGALGLGDPDNRGTAPGEMGDDLPAVDLGTGRTARMVAAGNWHTCALLDDGSVKCWGQNSRGSLGLGGVMIPGNTNAAIGDQPGDMGNALPTVGLGSGRTALAVTAGSEHSCAVLDDGSLKCWGFFPAIGSGANEHLGDEAGEMGDDLPVVRLGTGRTVRHPARPPGPTPTPAPVPTVGPDDPPGDGEPVLRCLGQPATIVGDIGRTTIVGTSGDDVIVARAPDATIRGGGGDDVICASGGANRILGGAGDDRLVGASSADRLSGGPGNDVLVGRGGDDRLVGGSGNDRLRGGPGRDRCDGGGGTDRGVGCEIRRRIP
jgi:alpha-tubulin suppressor-like RCC1 family protein